MTRGLAVALACALSGSAFAQTADFDSLTEGTNGAVIVDNSIRFSNIDNNLGPGPGNAAIEDASDSLAGYPGFSANNCLGFGGYSEGPGAAFGRFRSVDIERQDTSNAARVELFEFGTETVTVRLEAYLADVMVNSAEVQLSGGFVLAHHTLELQGETFDKLRLRVDPDTGDVAFILIDNVRIALLATGDTDVPTDTDTATDDPPDTGDDGDTDVIKTVGGQDDNATADTDTSAVDTKSGCGCATGSAAQAGWLAAGALAFARRRRRTTRG